jgi:hypothetical protein
MNGVVSEFLIHIDNVRMEEKEGEERENNLFVNYKRPQLLDYKEATLAYQMSHFVSDVEYV